MSAKSLLRQASASPLCLMKPARAIILEAPVAFPFSSHYTRRNDNMVSNGCGIADAAREPSAVLSLACAKDTVTIRTITTITYSGDFDLDGGVVLGSNESVGGATFTGDVELHDPLFVVLHIV